MHMGANSSRGKKVCTLVMQKNPFEIIQLVQSNKLTGFGVYGCAQICKHIRDKQGKLASIFVCLHARDQQQSGDVCVNWLMLRH